MDFDLRQDNKDLTLLKKKIASAYKFLVMNPMKIFDDPKCKQFHETISHINLEKDVDFKKL